MSTARPPLLARGRALAADAAKQVGELREHLGDQPVVGPLPEPLAVDHAGDAEHLEVMAHQGLGRAEVLGQVAQANTR